MQDLIMHERPVTDSPVMVLGLTGWMDGGRVSTATVGFLGERLEATSFAEIVPDDFYIFNFPVSTLPISVYLEGGRTVVVPVSPMESAAIFRPHTEIEDGMIREVQMPANQFWYSPSADLALFSGDEPHIRWGSYCDCIFEVAREMNVRRMVFIGSVAGTVPHTREPRMRAMATEEDTRAKLESLGLTFTTYEGPASIINSLARHAPDEGIEFISMVVDIPHYPFIEMPTYPRSILRMAAVVGGLLGIDLDLGELREADDTVQTRLSAVMAENEDFAALVARLEEAYDLEESGSDEALLRQLIESIDLEGDTDAE